MRTKILCLSGIDSPEMVRHAYNKAQEIKSSLTDFFSKVLSGTCDLTEIKGSNKEYFVDFFKGRSSLPRGFIVFFLDLLSIENHPLPPSASILDLYEIYKSDTELPRILRSYYESNEIIIANDRFWKFLYHLIRKSNPVKICSILRILKILSSKECHDLLTNVHTSEIWHEEFWFKEVDNDSMIHLQKWKMVFLKMYDQNGFQIALIATILSIPSKISINRQTENLLSTFSSCVQVQDKSSVLKISSLFLRISNLPIKESEIIRGYLYFLINKFNGQKEALIHILELFSDNLSFFIQTIFYGSPNTDIKYLKNFSQRIMHLLLTQQNGIELVDKHVFKSILIMAKYKEHRIYSDNFLDTTLSRNENSLKTHELLFTTLFVKYQPIWYLVKNLPLLSKYELDILFGLLAGNSLKSLPDLPLPLSKKEAHIFLNFSPDDVKITNDPLLCGIIHAKIVGLNLRKEIISQLMESVINQITVQRIKGDIEFWTDVFSFFKKYEKQIPDFQYGPIIDFIIFNRYQRADRKSFSLKETTLISMISNINAWHRALGNRYKHDKIDFDNLKWNGIDKPDFICSFEDRDYIIHQLKSGLELFEEGSEMKHCVFSYRRNCLDGKCSIWSLREITNDSFKRLSTIEVRNNTIVQIRKQHNHLPDRIDHTIINLWKNKTKAYRRDE